MKALLISAGLLLASPVFAQNVDLGKSQLVFTMKQMGVPVSGSFKKFAAKVKQSRNAVDNGESVGC